MKCWTAGVGLLVVALLAGCNPTTRYRVLSLFFDGVPPPVAEEAQAGAPTAAGGGAAAVRRPSYREHGPYGARLCNACHEPGSLNALVATGPALCLRCHGDSIKPKKFVHGPLASGPCTTCHDPHSSQYTYLLLGEPTTFCFRCHEQAVVARVPAHAKADGTCTSCHDPHGADKRFLLR